jgi:hypothetical protein
MKFNKWIFGLVAVTAAICCVSAESQTNSPMDKAAPFQSIEQVAAHASWSDNFDAAGALLVNTASPGVKTSLFAVQTSYSTGSNTFVQGVAFAGTRERGGGGAAGGLKSSGTFTLPIVHRVIHTVQSVAAGMVYVSGSDGGISFGVSRPAHNGWEDYVVTTLLIKASDNFYFGGTAAVIGVSSYVGLVADASF